MSNINKAIRIEFDKKFIVVSDWSDPNTVQVKELAAVTKSTYQSTEGKDFHYMKDWCFPYTEEIYNQFVSICTERQKLKKAFDDSMSLVYQTCNTISRGEL